MLKPELKLANEEHTVQSAVELFDKDDKVTLEFTNRVQNGVKGVIREIRSKFPNLCKSKYQLLTQEQASELHDLLKTAIVCDDRTERWSLDIGRLLPIAIWINSLEGQIISHS